MCAAARSAQRAEGAGGTGSARAGGGGGWGDPSRVGALLPILPSTWDGLARLDAAPLSLRLEGPGASDLATCPEPSHGFHVCKMGIRVPTQQRATVTRKESGAGPEGGAGAGPGDVSRWVKRVGGAAPPGAGAGVGTARQIETIPTTDGPRPRA